jgi:phosphoribosylformylglycinamidine synthase
MKAVINIYLKEGVLDSAGKATNHALHSLNFDCVKDVRIGKQIVLELDSKDKEDAMSSAKDMAEQLLANTVIEDYSIEII